MVYGSIIIIWEAGGPNYLGHPPRLIVATIFLKLGSYFRGGFLIIYSSAIPSAAAIKTLKSDSSHFLVFGSEYFHK